MISVCMATYNGQNYIEEQIQSILAQLSPNDEVIVADDGSTDATINIIQGFKDQRIKIFQNPRPKTGLSPIQLVTTNFEYALQQASGDVIFLSDQDDVWVPDKVTIMLHNLQSVNYVVSDCYITDRHLNILYKTRFYPTSGITRNKWLALFKATPYQGGCVAFDRSVLAKALPFPKNIQSHDRWIGFVASFFFKYKILDTPLILYRRHSVNVSTATEKSTNTFSYRVRVRLQYIFELLKLYIR